MHSPNMSSLSDFIIRQISARYVWSFGSKFEVGLQSPINCQNDEDQVLFIQGGPMRVVHHLYHGWTIITSQKCIYMVSIKSNYV